MTITRQILAAATLVVCCGEIQPPCLAESSEWQKSVVSNSVRPKKKFFYNSPHMAIDQTGKIHVGYVQTKDNTDLLVHARRRDSRWIAEVAMQFQHSGKPMSGIDAFALAVGRQGSPHFYVYSKDYSTRGPIFREHWAFKRGRRWTSETIRESVKKLGGAGLTDPNIAIDNKGYLHVCGYVHNGFGTYHRVRHRYFDGRGYRIDALPVTSGRKDSGKGNLFIDARGTIHFVYETERALNRSTNAHPDYPDAALAYATFNKGRWSSPSLIRGRVSPDPNQPAPKETKYHIVSIGFTFDGKTPHVLYAISRRKRAHPTFIIHATLGTNGWQERRVIQFTNEKKPSHATAIFGPVTDSNGDVHFAFDTDVDSRYAMIKDGKTTSATLPGDLGGFVLDKADRPILLTRVDSELAIYEKP